MLAGMPKKADAAWHSAPEGTCWKDAALPKPSLAAGCANALPPKPPPPPLPADGPKGLALGPRPAAAGEGAKMLAWPLEEAAEERRPSVVVLLKVEGAKGSAGDGLADGKVGASDRLHAYPTASYSFVFLG